MSGSQVPNPHRDTINADRISEKRFICDDCEHRQLAFDKTHTKMHTIVRVSEKGEENQVSVEEGLGGGRQANEWGEEGYFSVTRRMIQRRFHQENWIPQA